MRRHAPLSLILTAAAALAACGGPPAGSAASRAPNVLVLVADDLGAELGCYGVPGLETPCLDRLAAEGVRFTRAFAPSGVCVPSRTTLYTGREPARHGADGFGDVAEGVPLWGDVLGAAGFRTGLLGKLGARPAPRFRFDWIERTDRTDEGARDLAFHVERLGAFLDADDGRPWAMVVNFRDAHWPFPTDGAPPTPDAGMRPHDPAAVAVPPVLTDAPATRAELARYHDALRRLDATAGALLDELARRGLAGDTLVLFTSDNGPPFPGAKTTLYEWGLRQALLARWPGVTAPGRVEERLVTLADILPTVLELAGAPADGMDGRSLVSLLAGEEAPWRDAVFGSHTGHRKEPAVPARSVRAGRFKYIWNPHPEREFSNLVMDVSDAWRDLVRAAESGDASAAAAVARQRWRPAEELYDLEADPWERANLARDAARAETLADLRARLGAHLAQQGDPLLELWPH